MINAFDISSLTDALALQNLFFLWSNEKHLDCYIFSRKASHGTFLEVIFLIAWAALEVVAENGKGEASLF